MLQAAELGNVYNAFDMRPGFSGLVRLRYQPVELSGGGTAPWRGWIEEHLEHGDVSVDHEVESPQYAAGGRCRTLGKCAICA